MPNLYAQFRELLPDNPQVIVKVISTDGVSSVVQHLGGDPVDGFFGFGGVIETVQGSETAGSCAYLRGGVLVGPAPSLPVVEVVLYGM